MANEWHVPYELLNPETQDMARAIQSLMEELEAVDWYNQRAQVASDRDLRLILEHNRDEEKEHASMLLEWIRRKDPSFDAALKTYLFTSREITELEDAATASEVAAMESQPEPSVPEEAAVKAESASPSFTIGSLRGLKDA